MVGVIKTEYEKFKFENGNTCIEKQSGELKVKFRQKCVSVMRKWGTSQLKI